MASGCTATAATSKPTASATDAPAVNATTASHAPTSSDTGGASTGASPDAASAAATTSAARQAAALTALTAREAAVARDAPEAGLVVASTTVSPPGGSVGFHLQVVATGDDDHTIVTSAFHSNPPGAEHELFLRQYDESIGSCVEDGVRFGYTSWGGVNSAQSVPATVGLSTAGDDPSFLKDAVITDTATPSDPSPSCLFRVVAVAPLTWSTPVRHPGLVVVDGGSRAGASGAVLVVGGKPRSYTIAAGDTPAGVCARLGVTCATSAFSTCRRSLPTRGSRSRPARCSTSTRPPAGSRLYGIAPCGLRSTSIVSPHPFSGPFHALRAV